MADVLPSPEVSELDLEGLKEEIRQEVAALRSSGRQFLPEVDPDTNLRPAGRQGTFDATSVRALIDLTNSFADVGLNVPPVNRFRGVTRRLARLTARMILALSRFITDRQRNYNHLTIRGLTTLADGLENTTADLEERVHALEELSRRQAEQISSLQAALKNRSGQVQDDGLPNAPDQPEA